MKRAKSSAAESSAASRSTGSSPCACRNAFVRSTIADEVAAVSAATA
jgi:hypothetical protein